jgi:predicted DCC family thiol-disulfide oxidoreductase YuxK
MEKSIRPGKIILFDGVCNLCNASVQFVVKRDRKKQFIFASLQSTAAGQLLANFHQPGEGLYSFLLIEENKLFSKSTAALRVLKSLAGLWPLLYIFIVVPTFIRDGIYDLVANNRYRWFGKKNECWIPDDQLKSRFLE